jgi:hypothetical protein
MRTFSVSIPFILASDPHYAAIARCRWRLVIHFSRFPKQTTPSRHISPSSLWQLLCLHPQRVRMHECINQYIYNNVLTGSRYSMLHRARGAVGVVHRRHTNTRNAFDRNFGWRSGIRGGKYAGEAQDRTGVIV